VGILVPVKMSSYKSNKLLGTIIKIFQHPSKYIFSTPAKFIIKELKNDIKNSSLKIDMPGDYRLCYRSRKLFSTTIQIFKHPRKDISGTQFNIMKYLEIDIKNNQTSQSPCKMTTGDLIRQANYGTMS
jgi:hypothetical protein